MNMHLKMSGKWPPFSLGLNLLNRSSSSTRNNFDYLHHLSVEKNQEIQIHFHGLENKFKTTRLTTLRPRRNGQHFADDIFKHIFFNENVWISIKILLKFVLKGPINNIPALVQIMAWRYPGNKPLSEPMLVGLLTHTCVTRPQWVNAVRVACPAPAHLLQVLKTEWLDAFPMCGQVNVMEQVGISW